MDSSNHKTMHHRPLKALSLGASPHIFLKKEFHDVLRKKLSPISTVAGKRHKKRTFIFESLKKGEAFEEYPYCSSLFVDNPKRSLGIF